jgi:hypothetical protein
MLNMRRGNKSRRIQKEAVLDRRLHPVPRGSCGREGSLLDIWFQAARFVGISGRDRCLDVVRRPPADSGFKGYR